MIITVLLLLLHFPIFTQDSKQAAQLPIDGTDTAIVNVAIHV